MDEPTTLTDDEIVSDGYRAETMSDDDDADMDDSDSSDTDADDSDADDTDA